MHLYGSCANLSNLYDSIRQWTWVDEHVLSLLLLIPYWCWRLHCFPGLLENRFAVNPAPDSSVPDIIMLTLAHAAATNFPRHRGTATAFPLAAYGLSAFFFSSIAAAAFHDDTGSFLMLLAIAPGTIALISTFFIKTFPPSAYHSVRRSERPESTGVISNRAYTEPGTQETTPLCSGDTYDSINTTTTTTITSSSNLRDAEAGHPTSMAIDENNAASTPSSNARGSSDNRGNTANDDNAMAVSETSSLMSGRNSTSSHNSDDMPPTASHHHSLYTDVRGWDLLNKIEFWQLVALLGLLSGIGLMTIK